MPTPIDVVMFCVVTVWRFLVRTSTLGSENGGLFKADSTYTEFSNIFARFHLL
jgi:hypothetical protein